jgi:hypothetical protein
MISFMISGSVRDTVKPVTSMAVSGLRTDWLRVCGSHDVQSSSTEAAHQQDEYPTATDSRCSAEKIISKHPLTEASHREPNQKCKPVYWFGSSRRPSTKYGWTTNQKDASHDAEHKCGEQAEDDSSTSATELELPENMSKRPLAGN